MQPSGAMLDPFGSTDRMDPKRRRNISMLYGEQQTSLSNTLRAAMMREGFQDIRVFADGDALAEAVRMLDPDIILTDVDLPGRDPCGMVKEIREGRLGRNPFVPVILTTWDPRESLVRRVVDCGSDDLLIKPLSPNQILVRIGQLVHRRKPFVVTSDYIGPDRRKSREEEGDLPRLRVPNTLRTKALGESDPSEFDETIEAALKQINEQRLKRHSREVSCLVQIVVPAYRAGTADLDTEEHLQRMLAVGEDASKRLRGTRYEHVSEICSTLSFVAERVARDHPAPSEKDLQLLPRLADAMVIGFNPDQDIDRLSRQITESVKAYLTGSGKGARVL